MSLSIHLIKLYLQRSCYCIKSKNENLITKSLFSYIILDLGLP